MSRTAGSWFSSVSYREAFRRDLAILRGPCWWRRVALIFGYALVVMMVCADFDLIRVDHASARQEAADRFVELQGERARLDAESRRVAAQTGPARFLTAQLGTDAESVIKWLVALLVMLIDPSAVAAEAPLPGKPKSQ